MHQILLITDDWDHKKSLKSGLLEKGFSFLPVPSIDIFEDTFSPKKPEIVIVDLERCQIPPAKLCHAVNRERTLRDLPLLMLLPEDQLERLDRAWDIDDYLTLPVSPTRLVERLNFILWKLGKPTPFDRYVSRGLEIDFERYEVHVQGSAVGLTFKEFELLKFLATHPGKVFTREVLLDKVWGYDYFGGTRTVDVHIRRLRSKLEAGGTVYIETVRNVGYKFLSSPDTDSKY